MLTVQAVVENIEDILGIIMTKEELKRLEKKLKKLEKKEG